MSATTVTTRAAARVVDAVKIYGKGDTEVRALDGVSVDFPAGRFTAIMGPSGSGKSTLMHCAAGLDTLTSGSACIGGTDLSTLDDSALTLLRRERVGFVFQAFNLVPTLTVAENITLPMDLAGAPHDRERLDDLIDTVGLRDRLHHRPSELSGGQQQRVAVARAFAGGPDVVFADEPTGNLDSRAGEEVLRLLGRTVRRTGRTVVMVTHDPVAAAHADEVIFLADGRLVDRMQSPTAERVLDRMKAFDARGASDTGASDMGSAHTDPAHMSTQHMSPGHMGPADMAAAHTGSGHMGPAHMDSAPMGSADTAPAHTGPDHVAPDHMAPDHTTPVDTEAVT